MRLLLLLCLSLLFMFLVFLRGLHRVTQLVTIGYETSTHIHAPQYLKISPNRAEIKTALWNNPQTTLSLYDPLPGQYL